MGDMIYMSKKELTRVKSLSRLINKEMTQSIAAKELGVSVRHVKRLLKAYRESGELGILSKRRGKPSNHQINLQIKLEVLELVRLNYPDFGPTLAHEKLAEEHGLQISISTVRNIMVTHGIWKSKKQKKTVVHQMRERRSQEGELVQIDGSPHDWFEGRAPKCDLLVYIDDATGKLHQLHFAPAESTASYYEATRKYIEKYGRPIAFYSDKHSVFKVNAKEALSGNGLTQFGRAMQELDIKIICANTPQAKGRVEKANKTLQDRLVKELRLRNISSIDEANAFLPSYIEAYNKRFAKVPKSPLNAHRSLSDFHNLDDIFSLRFTRTLSKNLIMQYKNVLYQIVTDRPGYALRNAKVDVLENMKGDVAILYKGEKLHYTIYHQQECQAKVIDSKVVNLEIDNLKKLKHKPTRNHPWRRAFI